ncbi:A/G-specific adenine glycosylase [Nakamurella endophytica]|uniref:Adenine DNA glycosylase n=1 Tax=Nakamurella endophytica TaxID=1748367 RepID=A0A917SYV6_9ACTN|nr:A/G-specific adenine glycosylase [Nakamurella endophytica]GGM04202.1 A/G-specific adenine glycosylase [Nakamurella endophytica]
MPAAAGAPTPVLDPELLLDFFARHGRDLPWRHPSAGPWAVLVSEFMLQQTPVRRVLPVHQEWLARWPTPADLAAEPAGEAVRAWGRLGYPRRALRLHAAATAIARDHGGRVPSTVPELLALPGVGEYTARAVAAFAFGAREPVVDTNVRRVLDRAVRGVDSIREPAVAADRRDLAALLPVEPARAARFSAAVMELGALVCTAAAPACDRCPLVARCRWYRAGRPAGTARRPVQTWHGSDRQLRGRMVAALRAERAGVAAAELLLLGDDRDQARRCLAALIADGLAEQDPDGRVDLPR